MVIRRMSQEDVIEMVSSKKVKAAERIIAPRTDYVYFFSLLPGRKVRIYGHRKDGSHTQVIVKI